MYRIQYLKKLLPFFSANYDDIGEVFAYFCNLSLINMYCLDYTLGAWRIYNICYYLGFTV